MLDLKARVHLDEIEFTVLVQELDGSSSGIAEIGNSLGNDAADARTLVSSGWPTPGLDVRIVDPDSRRGCEPGAIGEIWVRGDSIAAGYWRNDAATQRAFGARLAGDDGAPYLRTGDLGFLRDGELFVTGRLKDLIIVRGRNHYPQDIELTVTKSHDGLQPGSAAAFTLDEGDTLGVVVEVRRGFGADVDFVESAIVRAVADAHGLVVEQLALIRPGSLPKTSSGKVRRFLCRTRLRDGALSVIERNAADAA